MQEETKPKTTRIVGMVTALSQIKSDCSYVTITKRSEKGQTENTTIYFYNDYGVDILLADKIAKKIFVGDVLAIEYVESLSAKNQTIYFKGYSYEKQDKRKPANKEANARKAEVKTFTIKGKLTSLRNSRMPKREGYIAMTFKPDDRSKVAGLYVPNNFIYSSLAERDTHMLLEAIGTDYAKDSYANACYDFITASKI